LEVCVAIVSEEEKSVGSTEGMERSRLSSPYYQAWLDGNNADVLAAEKLVIEKDFEKLADLSEFSCMKMHAMAMASQPGLLYWKGTTVELMHEIRSLRSTGTPVFFTVDAGPQVKAICAPGYGAKVADALSKVNGVKGVIRCGLGNGAHASN
jgi:diphosphomevalonate decarboxylase